jgi:hypothetical protein
MEGGEDGMRNIWGQGSWQRADIEGWTRQQCDDDLLAWR